MSLSPIERAILWAAIEDYAGLWELLWELAANCPEVPPPKRRAVAEEAVRRLLERNFIELYERTGRGGKEQPLSKSRWNAALSDDINWSGDKPSGASIEILIGATESGEAFHAMDPGG